MDPQQNQHFHVNGNVLDSVVPDTAQQLNGQIPQVANGNGILDPVMQPGQPFIQDPATGAGMLPVPGAGFFMPLMMANGAQQQQQEGAANGGGISADDLALYDRQIRLWGVAAQAKIQSANILLITIKALASEVAKNLVLAGVGSITILDDSAVTEADVGAQFFLSEADGNLVGQNRAQAASRAMQELNPRVRVHVDAGGIKSKGPSYFSGFDVVIATDLDPDSFNLINTATRLNGKPFYAASSHGLYGFIFSDLIEHEFVIERDVGNVPTQVGKRESRTRTVIDVKTSTSTSTSTSGRDGHKFGKTPTETVTKRELYSTWFLASDVAVLPEEYTRSRRRLRAVSPALSCLRALWEFMQLEGGSRVPSNRDDLKKFTQLATQKHKALSLPPETLTPEFLRSFLQNLGSELAPVTAILGGQLAQDVINVLGQKEQPIQNMVIFDGNSMEALVYPLHPEGVLGAGLLTMDSSVSGADVAGVVGGQGLSFDQMMPPPVSEV
ncbi:ubiquitin-like 1-activating enzyme E1 A [Geosmithia morbida]|uniref:Ubiquitin-like 1-activating enzyme E1A n=1 Tax=Geosmithia morbida TaxID=1094350 RepID=A0A9P4YWU7_9HYPO|nr:ubiquitin-like 1-activating enzyme E1 A [Geosmithia morbida]KAF4123176.1 ubiquitin-like 1-activating enzyme E1 A [Geosmithia morbida]